MTIEEARTLIGRLPLSAGPQRWVDLGCGGGTFTLALAELLPAGSSILAWDMNAFALRHIPDTHNGVRITTQQADFLRAPLPTSLDGIVMANALHFVKDQGILLSATNKALAEQGSLLLVEYDTDVPVHTWVPFPVSFQRSIALLPQHGYSVPERLGARPSAYDRGDLYAAFARRVASSNPR
ncbi:MAG: class I SAM-dependent methyltransferase [Flavobacteriales bacterium]|nr:class I SAM-dependent methyltransferase [Flavobacteriales bacterium]